MKLRLAQFRFGRVLLHVVCCLRKPRDLGWHWRGILRECASPSFVKVRLSPEDARDHDLREPFSFFAFKDKTDDNLFRKIGEQLHVSTVLEGSARKCGNQLRIIEP